MHGDAAFPGEGVVAETLNMSRLRGYRVGGTLHIIANNQVGFTTDPTDARSTHYASDLAKGFDIPIVHVTPTTRSVHSGGAARVAYRAKFGKDFLIDLVGYRRHGHNETDEPAFTQPSSTRDRGRIRRRARCGASASCARASSRRRCEGARRRDRSILDSIQSEQRTPSDELTSAPGHGGRSRPIRARVRRQPCRREQLRRAERAAARRGRQTSRRTRAREARFERRREAMGEAGGIDWGHAEALAFASLLAEGTSVRISRARTPSAERSRIGRRCCTTRTPARRTRRSQHLAGRDAERSRSTTARCPRRRCWASSTASAPRRGDALVLWEAQFGDFVNVAQPIIDQFIAAGPREVGAGLALVLLLPHGYEGAGPGALERAARAVPAVVRRGQHARRVSVDAGAVLPHPAPSGADGSRAVRWC